MRILNIRIQNTGFIDLLHGIPGPESILLRLFFAIENNIYIANCMCWQNSRSSSGVGRYINVYTFQLQY